MSTSNVANQAEVLGYVIEQTGNLNMPYHLIGKRGATYGLMRNARKPELLFVVTSTGCTDRALKGYRWFTDRNGVIEPVNVL